MSSRLRLDSFVPALFAAAAILTAARAVTVLGHAVEHPTARAWLVVGCDLLRTGIGVAFAVLTIGRAVPRRPAREPIAFLACAVAMGTAVASHDPSAQTPSALVILGELTAVIGFAWMIVSVTFLGRCFGVLPEARGLVTGGPYGIVRHPVYLGEIAACGGLTIAAPTVVNAVILAVFAGAQAIRMRLEERALRDAFPDEYGRYARSVPRIIPVARGPATFDTCPDPGRPPHESAPRGRPVAAGCPSPANIGSPRIQPTLGTAPTSPVRPSRFSSPTTIR